MQHATAAVRRRHAPPELLADVVLAVLEDVLEVELLGLLHREVVVQEAVDQQVPVNSAT
jgi:hypothetical protein